MSAATKKRIWRIVQADRSKAASLAAALGIPRIAAHLLILRGVDTAEEGARFLAPSLDQLSDPFLLTDMRAAVDRLHTARARDEQVLVFGDYDMDGIAGTAVLYQALARYGLARCSYGLPNRQMDGYGLSPGQVEDAARAGVSLIVTVDNGTAAHEAATAAKRLGVDLIVTDHHQIDGELPEAVAVINPKREGPAYPGAHSSGSAVAFKLATALLGELHDLDLTALGIVADVVPLQGENRILAAHGIRQLSEQPRVGLLKLAEVAGIRLETVTAENITFQLAPRVNASGRVGDGLAGLRLLLTDSPAEARELALELNAANEERRGLEKAIFDDAMEELAHTFRPEQRSIVLARKGWHTGVIGIVAARVHGAYNRPTILIGINGDGVGRGSARSTIPDFNLVDTLTACREHLVRFGGHRAAAGMSVLESNVEAFQTAFETEAARRLPPGELIQELSIDAQVSLGEIDAALLATLGRLEPCGQGNPAPVFCTLGARALPGSIRELRGGHLRMVLQEGSRAFTAIGFNMADPMLFNWAAERFDVAFTPKFNTWQGETSIQLVLKDIRAAEA